MCLLPFRVELLILTCLFVGEAGGRENHSLSQTAFEINISEDEPMLR